MQIAVGIDRYRLFAAQFKHRLGCLPGGKITELSAVFGFHKCPKEDVLFSSLDKWEVFTLVIPFHRSFLQIHIFHTMGVPSQLLLMK